jgi:uncharacterized membrane protein
LIFRIVLRLLLAALFLTAGVIHLRVPALFLPIMPPQIPFPTLCVIVSGIFELMGGVGLLVPLPWVQLLTGWGLLLLLIAVFPANIYMAINHIQIHGVPSHRWMGWARLPLQPLIMLAVAWVTGLWPRLAEASSALPSP